MPSSQIILTGLAQSANRGLALAIAIHVVFGLLAVAYAFGARPTRGLGLLLVSLLHGTVATLALAVGNPFNASVFGLLCLAHALAALTWQGSGERTLETPVARAIGWSMLTFGWVYPHFLERVSPLAYLIAAPLGLLPCPTLAFSLGLRLSGLVRAPAALSVSLAVVALFYGLFGVLRLGVLIDGALIVGASAQLLLELHSWRTHARAMGAP